MPPFVSGEPERYIILLHNYNVDNFVREKLFLVGVFFFDFSSYKVSFGGGRVEFAFFALLRIFANEHKGRESQCSSERKQSPQNEKYKYKYCNGGARYG